MGDISAHFSRSEFRCHHCGHFKIDPQLLWALEELRNHYGQPVHVLCGYRCVIENQNVGGAPDSLHMGGCAADISVANLSPPEVKRWLESLRPKVGGLGLYPGFVHVDTGPVREW